MYDTVHINYPVIQQVTIALNWDDEKPIKLTMLIYAWLYPQPFFLNRRGINISVSIIKSISYICMIAQLI